jgi:hypothetical protein
MRNARIVLLAFLIAAGVSSTLAWQSSPNPDVNRDGVVTAADAAIVQANLGRRCGQATFDPRADVDGSCVVNVVDLTIVTRNIGRVLNQPPVARIAQPATAFVGQPVTLDGRASSDAENAPLSYQWQLTSRPAGSIASVAAPAAALTSFVPDRPGTYQVLLVVGDGTLTGQAGITVTTTNVAPVAAAGGNQTARVGDTVTFDGTGSSDADGDALQYAWSIAERPASSTSPLADPAAARPTLLIDAAGTYVLHLVVTDTGGLSSAPSEVRVSTLNSPPTANAGPDQTVAVNALVRLTGAGSSDPDGDLLAYRWELVSVPGGSPATLASPTSVDASFVADRAGDFLIRLTVTDPAGESASDTVTVTTVNSAPHANAGEDQSVAVAALVTLDGSGSTDVDGDPLTYAWSFASRPEGSSATLSDVAVARPTFTVDIAGTYVLQILVSDGRGGSSSDTVVISTLNSRPIAVAGPDQVVTVGRVVTLDGTASRDADGDLLTYAWALTTVPDGSTAVLSDPTGTQPQFTVDRNGTFVAQLIVSDGQLASIADTVSVSTTNATPVANAGEDLPRRPIGAIVTLDGTGSSDADGHTLSYLWALLSRPSGSAAELDQPTSATPSFTVDAGGDFILQLTVSDGFASSPPDTVLVRGNMAPVANAGPDGLGSVGNAAPLSGAGSLDADGDSLTYSWTLEAPVGSTAVLSNPTAVNPSFVPDIGGDYLARLVVHDGLNGSAPDTVTIAVAAPRGVTLTPPASSVLTFETVTLTVSLESQAPAGGLLLTLHSSDDTVALPPPDVTVPAGQTSATFDVVTFANAGTASIAASVAGAQPGTATITVGLRTLSLTLEAPVVGVNRTIDATVTLAQPAPSGGATITLTSAVPDIVGTSPGAVAIAGGATTAPLILVGVVAGDTSLTASAAGFAPVIVPIAVRYTLALAPSPVTLERGSSASVTVMLSAPAPSGGATVALSTDAPTTASVAASVIVPGGATSATAVVNGLADGTTTLRAIMGLADAVTVEVTVTPPLPAQIESSPANGEGDVAVTRETILRFSRPLATDAAITSQNLYAEFGGLLLSTRVHVSPDRKTVTLFYLQTLPASARVRVHFNTDGLRDAIGVLLDGDQNGQPGGTKVIDFDTLTLTTLEGTAVVGRVFASELGDGGINTPLADVIISVDGLETTLRTTTDAMGNFRLAPAPAGAFFVHIDGRSATNNVPVGAYYPPVGKKWVATPGEETDIGDVFLPLVVPGTLQPVSETQDTTITFPASVLAQHPSLAGVNLIVPADSLYTDGGARGGMVGIAPVAPDRIPSPLPPGLNLALVITVQTDGATNFDRPVSVCFPNLPDPTTGLALAPRAKSGLWSFNHDTGEWEVVGPMTVASNGSLVCSDPGFGILQPGWHGQTPGTQAGIDLKGERSNESLNCHEALVATVFSGWSWVKGLARVATPAGGAVIGGFVGAGVGGPPGAVFGANAGFVAFENAANKANVAVDAVTGALQSVTESLLRQRYDTLIADALEAFEEPFAADILHSINPYLSYGQAVLKIKDDSEKLGQGLGGIAVHCLGVGPQPPNPPPPPMPPVDTNAAYNALVTANNWPAPTADEYQLFEDLVNSTPEFEALGAPMAELIDYAESGVEVIELLSEENPDPTPEEIADLIEALEQFRENAEFVAEFPESFADSIDPRVRETNSLLNQVGQRIQMPIAYTLTYGETVIRGASTTGHIDAILPSNAIVAVTILNPVTLQTGGGLIVTGDAGSRLSSIPAMLFDDPSPDTDSDGLTDIAEDVLGTNAQQADSDGDGVTDAAEVQQGTNPLDGLPARTGIIATVDTPGLAIDLAVRNDIAVVADGFNGVAVFNVAAGANPVAIAQVDTPGIAQGVAFQGSLVAVADGFSGLTIVDISDPPAARVLHQLPATTIGSDVRAVAVSGDRAYAGGSDRVVIVDMPSGTVLNTIFNLVGVSDLAFASDELYVLTNTTFRIYKVVGTDLELLSSTFFNLAPAPFEIGRRIFVGGGLAYIGHFTGFHVFDVTEPSVPRLIGSPSSVNLAMHDVAANGSGLVLGATSFSGTASYAISLFDGSDPTDTDRFLTSFSTPGDSRAFWIYNGLAYVADQGAGMQVVNYLPYDADGVAPTVTLSSNFTIGSTTGVAEQDAPMRLTANVTDDVQVRNVDFYVDGRRVARDGSFPFEERFTTPRLSERTSFTVRACASDTGGNSSCTDDIVVSLVPDATRPQILDVSPDNATSTLEVTQISVDFNEDIDQASLDNALTLAGTGPDQQFDTADDVAVAGNISYLAAQRRAVVTFAEPLLPGVYRGRVGDQVADLAGNRLVRPFTWIFSALRLPRVSLVTTDGQASEADLGPGSFTVTRTGDLGTSLQLDFTIGGTADIFDYQFFSPFLFFQPGQSSATVPVTPILDALLEGDEALIVSITPTSRYVVAPPDTATVTIGDSGITLSIAATDPNASEETLDPGMFTITRTGPTGISVPVNLVRGGTATNGFDYQHIDLTAFIESGAASVTIPVTPILDALLEGTESVTLTLAAGGYVVGAPATATVNLADSGTNVTIAATDPDASEAGANNGLFTVSRTGPTAFPLTVNLTRGGTATATTDYANVATSVTILQGQSSATVTVTPVLDALLEDPETVVLTVAPGAYTVGTPDSATVTIADSGTTVSIAATDATASESGGDPGVFTVTRTGPTGVALPVNFTIGGTATVATDYANIAASVTIPSGQASATVTVTPAIDGALEGNETVTLTLAAGGYTVGSPSTAMVTIVDHLPVVTLSATDPSATEGGDTGTFTVTRGGSTGFSLTVNFTRAGTATAGTDYVNFATSVTIPIGQASATVTVTTLTDLVLDPDETVELTLAAGAYTPGTPGSATVTIVHAPPPISVSVFALDSNASESGGDNGIFQVFRGGDTSLPLTVNFTMSGTATEGTDYTALGGSVVIPAGQSNANVTVVPIADGLSEGTETVTLTLAPGLYTILQASSSATLNINDGAPPNTVSVIADDPDGYEEGVDTGSFMISRAGIVTLPLTVSFTLTGVAANGTDYQTIPLTATIPVNTFFTRVLVRPIADALAEGTESVVLTIAPGPYTVSATQPSATVTVHDGLAPSTVSITSPLVAYEIGPAPAPFVVSRNGGAMDVALTVNLTISGNATNGVDYEPIAATVVIPPGQSNVAIQLIPRLDAVTEVQENAIVSIAPGPYLISQFVNTATIAILDTAAPTVVSVLVTDPTGFEGGRDPAVFQLSRTGPTDINLTVNFTLTGPAVNGTDYDLVPLSTVIPAGQTAAYVTIVPVTDGIFENIESVVLTLAAGAYQGGTSTTAALTISDANVPSIVAITAYDAIASEVGPNQAVFLVSRTGSTSTAVTVNFSRGGTSTAGVDYVHPGFNFVIPEGEATTTLVITPIADALAETSETVLITLIAGTGYTVQGAGATATILDAAPPPPALAQVFVQTPDSAAYEGNHDAGTFYIQRLLPADSAVTVNVSISGTAVNGVDYETIPTTVVIPAGHLVVPVHVVPRTDAATEGRESVTITLAPGSYARLSSLTIGTVTIVDGVSDVANFVYVAAADATSSEAGGDTGMFVVGRTGSVDADLTVTLTRSGSASVGGDYVDFPTAVVIPAGQAFTTVTVTAVADGTPEPTETITLSIVAGADPIYPLAGTASLMIADFSW